MPTAAPSSPNSTPAGPTRAALRDLPVWTVVLHDGRPMVKGRSMRSGRAILVGSGAVHGVDVPSTDTVEIVAYPAEAAFFWLDQHTDPPTAGTPTCLPVGNICVRTPGPSAGGGGTITSTLHSPGDTPAYTAAIDAIESLVLAHACAGIDITSSRYADGVRTAIDAIDANIRCEDPMPRYRINAISNPTYGSVVVEQPDAHLSAGHLDDLAALTATWASTFARFAAWNAEQDAPLPAPTARIVCPDCNGKGTRLNAAFDGVTSGYFATWDADELDDLAAGMYDVVCTTCHHKRVVDVLDVRNAPTDTIATWIRWIDSRREADAIAAAERSVGA